MKDRLLQKINSDYQDLLSFDALIKEKRESVEQGKTKIFENKMDNLEDIASTYSDMYVDLVLFNRDLRVIFDRLHFQISLFNELGFEGLSKDVVNFYNESQVNVQKQMFIIKDDKVIEKEEGILEKERKRFLEGDLMKQIMNNK